MARSLVTARLRRELREAQGLTAEQPPIPLPDIPPLPRGHVRLFRHWQPSLFEGSYGIEAKQEITVTSTGERVTVFNYIQTNPPQDKYHPTTQPLHQGFNVIAPQFSLDPRLVNSVYPPPGFSDDERTLPHLVFNDPHTPWDRLMKIVTTGVPDPRGGTGETGGPITHIPSRGDTPSRVQEYVMPWLALVVFSPEELALTEAEEREFNIPAVRRPAPGELNPGSRVASPGSYPMSVGDYLVQVRSRVRYENVIKDEHEFKRRQSSQEETNVIFPKKDLVEQVLKPTLNHLLMSHVRQVSAEGLPDSDPDENAFFAVTISRRTGKTGRAANGTPVPATQVVHLVSLEGLDDTPLERLGDRIGLVSLYSWTYLCVPPNPVNFKDMMLRLADEMQMLMPPKEKLDSLSDSIATQPTPETQAAAQHLHDRLSRGYIISRWRTAVGQETAAFTRGPLVPLPTPKTPAPDWPGSSNSGKDYQILDRDLGVMDVTYSAAWQLGKMLAITDTIFNAALLRFRSLVYEAAASQTRNLVNSTLSRTAVIEALTQSFDELETAASGSRRPLRVVLPTSERVAPPLDHPDVKPIYLSSLRHIMAEQTSAGEQIYSDYNLGKANNSDWETIHKWLSDKLFLGGIPAHYLIPDPSMLPNEALRFFFIDDAWLDCFLDGALSVANHLESMNDKVRRIIKEVYNVYLRNDIQPLPIKPPIPRYGFILRSALIRAMPDLRLTVTCRRVDDPEQPDPSRQPMVRNTRLDDFTIFVLLDCPPQDVYEIVFAQPPHQQHYLAAAELGPPAKYEIRRLYSQNAPNDLWPPFEETEPRYPTPSMMAKWYDVASRCVMSVQRAWDTAAALAGPNFNNEMDSVTMALTLNDSSYLMILKPPVDSVPSPSPLPTRQLWVGLDNDTSPQPQPSGLASQTASKKGASSLPFTVHPSPSDLSIAIRGQSLDLSALNIPATLTASQVAVAATTNPRYFLVIHPDYRAASRLPYTDETDGKKTYSKHDFIPTATEGLLNLLICPQRLPFLLPGPGRPVPPQPTLVSITLEIPIHDPSNQGPDGEPLLEDTDSLQASMLSNKRVIPFLNVSPGMLHIRLAPRKNTGTLELSSVLSAGFRLSKCRISDIVFPRQVNIIGELDPVERGVCVVKMTETYILPNGTVAEATTQWDVIKRTGGDVDLEGRPV